MAQIGDRIREFIARDVMFEDDPSKVSDDMHLLGTVMDSLGLMQVVGFLEEEFDVEIEDEEVTADNFGTVAAIERLVSGKVKVG
jgi:acyl carrier protein